MYGFEIVERMKPCLNVSWKVASSDRLRVSSRPCMIICNTDESHMPGTHWIALYLDEKGRGECFDSYGRHPGMYHDNFTAFMNRHCSRWVYNITCLQAPFTRTCGHFCVAYALCKCNGYSLDEIVRCMEMSGEEVVAESVESLTASSM